MTIQGNRRAKNVRRSIQRLETRRLLAGDVGASNEEIGDFETDPRIISMFHGPRQIGQPVPPIQAFALNAPLAGGDFPTDGSDGDDSPQQAAPFPLEDTFKLHSRPDSNFTLYIDFDGHTTVGTSWNSAYGLSEIVHPNYWGTTNNNFSDSRLELIQEIWQVVADDFAPFDINVTTEEPADLDDLRRNGADDQRWGTRAVMTRDTFANCGCGGHAFLGAFDDFADEPALVYNGGLNAGSETVSHEVGHQLGLNHHGVGSQTYYGGHGNGATGWGPILGAPFSRQITQWSNGVYLNSNNTQDDLAVIVQDANFPYAPDDHADAQENATQISEVGITEIEGFGIIEQNTDADWFKFTTGAGNVSINVDVLGYKPNLDVWAGLFDSSGNFIQDSNPQDDLNAAFTDVNLAAGEYFIKIDGVARNNTYNPLTDTFSEPDPVPYTITSPIGYSDYGSLGQYGISGTVVASGTPTLSLAANTASVVEGFDASFTLTASDGGTEDVVIEVVRARQSAPGLPAPNSTEFSDFGGPTIQTVSLVGGTATFSIPVADDGVVEPDEYFEVRIVDSGTYRVADRVAGIEVLESRSAFGISAVDTRTAEGDSPTGSLHTFTIDSLGNDSIQSTVGWRRVAGGATDANDFVTAESGTFEFLAGETSKVLTIDIAGDIDVESNETYEIELTIPTGEDFLITEGRESAEGQIDDDESIVALSASSQFRLRQVAFSNGNFDHWAIDDFTITSTGIFDDFDPAIDNANWELIENAEPRDTFPGTDGDALFFNGFNGARIAETALVSPTPGAQVQFDLIFADANGGGLNATENGEDVVLEFSLDGNNWTEIERYDESAFTAWTPITTDLPSAATFEIPEHVESDTGTNVITFEIPRSGFDQKAIDVEWEVRPTGVNPVDASDFVGGLPSGTASFAIGESTVIVEVPVAGDYDVEPDETFEFVLLSNSGGPLASDPIVGTIVDDDLLGSDYGDAAGTFPVTLADNGARHDTSGPRLGSNRDGDLDGQASGDSAGDGADDDGVTFYEIGVDATEAFVSVNLQNATEAKVDAWVDFDGSGTWENDEKVLDNVAITDGDTLLSYNIGSDAVLGQAHARVRVSTAGGLSTTGFATDGEVEDYQVSIVPTPEVSQVSLNSGNSSRNLLTELEIEFDNEVEIQPDAFSIRHVGDDAVITTLNVSTTVTDGNTVALITFDPGSHVLTRSNGANSLVDGNYELSIDAAKVSQVNHGPALVGNVTFGDQASDLFFRYFGDTDGDRDVDISDLGDFSSAFRTEASDSSFLDRHDIDGDGDVDIQDLSEFAARFRTTLA